MYIFMLKFRQLFDFFTRSPQWKNVREEHIKKQPFCQACGRTDNLQVHHIEPVHKNKSRELDPTNLITLCGKNCHLVFGHLMDTRSWNDDVIIDSANYLQKVKQRPYYEKFADNNGKTNDRVLRGFFTTMFRRNNRSRD